MKEILVEALGAEKDVQLELRDVPMRLKALLSLSVAAFMLSAMYLIAVF